MAEAVVALDSIQTPGSNQVGKSESFAGFGLYFSPLYRFGCSRAGNWVNLAVPRSILLGSWSTGETLTFRSHRSTTPNRDFPNSMLGEKSITEPADDSPRPVPCKLIRNVSLPGRTGAKPTPQLPEIVVATPRLDKGVMAGSQVAWPS